MNTTTTVHVFERAGLGIAPFRYVGSTIRKYQACHGAPIQPGGSCDYCGNAIMECCAIEDSTGKRFTVGNVCVGKTADRGLIDPAARDLARLRREHAHERDDLRIAATVEALKHDAVRDALAAKPHPKGWSDSNLLVSVEWFLRHAGRAGKVKACRHVEAVLREMGQ